MRLQLLTLQQQFHSQMHLLRYLQMHGFSQQHEPLLDHRCRYFRLHQQVSSSVLQQLQQMDKGLPQLNRLHRCCVQPSQLRLDRDELRYHHEFSDVAFLHGRPSSLGNLCALKLQLRQHYCLSTICMFRQ